MNKHLFIVLLSMILISCGTDDGESIDPPVVNPPEEESPVVFNLDEVPYTNLSEYNFFEGNIVDFNPVYGVIPYELINPLFSDYSKKSRFVWMPDDVKATYVSDDKVLDFPVGAVLIKNFYYNENQTGAEKNIIETRIMFRSQSGWEFADYIWNEDQTDAVLNLEGGFEQISFTHNQELIETNYRIPTETECLNCHKVNEISSLIGPKPQNLNKNFVYEDGEMNQLQKWVEFGYLDNSNLPNSIETVADWSDENLSLEERVRGYIDINCAHCHIEDGHCDYTPMRFAWAESSNMDNLGICIENVEPLPGIQLIVNPGNSVKSALYARVQSNVESVRMPIIGRTIVHEEGVDLIEQWINGIETTCE